MHAEEEGKMVDEVENERQRNNQEENKVDKGKKEGGIERRRMMGKKE